MVKGLLDSLREPGLRTAALPPSTRFGTISSELLPRVHRVVSLLKRWILGTHQGAVSHEHLDSYLDEFTFRFNRRKSRSRGKLFYRLVQQAVAVQPVPYKSLVGGTATHATDNHNM